MRVPIHALVALQRERDGASHKAEAAAQVGHQLAPDLVPLGTGPRVAVTRGDCACEKANAAHNKQEAGPPGQVVRLPAPQPLDAPLAAYRHVGLGPGAPVEVAQQRHAGVHQLRLHSPRGRVQQLFYHGALRAVRPLGGQIHALPIAALARAYVPLLVHPQRHAARAAGTAAALAAGRGAAAPGGRRRLPARDFRACRLPLRVELRGRQQQRLCRRGALARGQRGLRPQARRLDGGRARVRQRSGGAVRQRRAGVAGRGATLRPPVVQPVVEGVAVHGALE
mmetsp:Transcript_4007/g.10029  ORF Transcript_4007/g.10029 Transcript_4007/m.10029 type:complete len:281 (+) Transcript_4007:774-1616(+)